MEQVALAAIAFVGSHFILSHPLRKPIVGAIGERGFLGVYALVAFATLGWLASAYRAAPATPMLWPVGDGLWAVATVVMLLASVLFVGSLIGNPALPSGGAPVAVPTAARGVFAVTRHPMMWGFALWAGCHALVYPIAGNIVLVAAIAAGRAKVGGFRPHDIAGGVVIWLAATWAHLPLAGLAAGVWRWL